MILEPSSLIKTIDNINTRHLLGEAVPVNENLEIAQWIISQQGKKGSYRGMPAPTQADFENGIRTFTGERLASASARHISGQEASRAAWLLGKSDPMIREAYEQATNWMHNNEEFHQTGTFCCGQCTLAFWRNYWVGEFNQKEEFLDKGLRAMKSRRSGDGRWHRFPFYYSIYSLMDINIEPAIAELRYALPLLEKNAKHQREDDYSKRRMIIIQSVLEKVN